MNAKLLDGRLLAKTLKEQLKTEVERLQKTYHLIPHLVNIVVGQDPSACAYAKSQQRCAEQIGIDYVLKSYPLDISQDDLIKEIHRYNKDVHVHGLMVHKPLPAHIDYSAVANELDPVKDLEGINVVNIGRMILNETSIFPCTPASVMAHLKSTGISLRGKEVVVVGSSEIVGKPLMLLLLNEFATVTVCHIGTSEAGQLQNHVQRADMLVVAVGRANLIPGDWIKPGAVVVDVGINHVNDCIVGDVDFEVARTRASYITPVPGGVGPVTVVMLMNNGIETFKQQIRVSSCR